MEHSRSFLVISALLLCSINLQSTWGVEQGAISVAVVAGSKENCTSTAENGTAACVNGTNQPIPGQAGTAHETQVNKVVNVTSTSKPTPSPDLGLLPAKGAAEEEHHSSMAIFFVLSVLGGFFSAILICGLRRPFWSESHSHIEASNVPSMFSNVTGLCILFIHGMIQTELQYIPESIVVIFLGALIGLFLKLISDSNSYFGNWQKEEALSPTAFFLVLLPPIIFESGYNLHKGNFFQNIGSICVFAIFGTVINAVVIGSGVYLLGLADIVYRLDLVQSFAFGSLISAVDPVATLAIFSALDTDPVLNMLVFGESILNDAVSIVLTSTVLQLNGEPDSTSTALQGISNFSFMFFASAGIGVAFALASALLLKHIDLRKNPSLEFGMMLIFTYGPYTLAEGIHLSGIMAILFCGIVMSHYTHLNLSPVTQITMQQTMRTLSFIAETCVFAYLGLAIFSFHHRIEISLVVWSICLCLIGRALNIFPLGALVNKFRSHQITKKMLFVMWFSGLRGAIAYALSLHLEFEKETRQVIITTTLIIILFTTLVFGGLTMPIVKYIERDSKLARLRSRRRRKSRKEISLSKTKEMGQTIDSEHLSELTEEELDHANLARQNGFVKLDIKYFQPFFTRRFTQKELKDCQTQMTDLTNRWYQNVRVSPINSEDEDEDGEEIVEFSSVTESCIIHDGNRSNSNSPRQ